MKTNKTIGFVGFFTLGQGFVGFSLGFVGFSGFVGFPVSWPGGQPGAKASQGLAVAFPQAELLLRPSHKQNCYYVLFHKQNCYYGLPTSRIATTASPRAELLLRSPRKQNCYYGLPASRIANMASPQAESLLRPPISRIATWASPQVGLPPRGGAGGDSQGIKTFNYFNYFNSNN